MVRAATLLTIVFAQAAALSVGYAGDRTVLACTDERCAGKRIRDNLGVLQFCVPRGLKVTKEVGGHGDVHYTIAAKARDEYFELIITSDQFFSGKLPDWAGGCELSRWHAPELQGEDCRIQRSVTRSRYMTLNTPMGYAFYRDVPPEVASRFDRLLDSLCWRDWRSASAMH